MTPPTKSDTNHTSHTSTDEPLTFEKVWLMFKQAENRFQENEKRSLEADQRIDELGNYLRDLSEKLEGEVSQRREG